MSWLNIFWGGYARSGSFRSLLILVIGFLAIKIVERVVLGRLKKWAATTPTTLDDFLINTAHTVFVPAAYFIVLFMSFLGLDLSAKFEQAAQKGLMAVLVFFGGRLATEFMTYGFKQYWRKRGQDTMLEGSLKGILNVLKFLVWGVAFALFLDNLGFKISAVIAGLGIGGVAVALAAQAVLGDLFSYFAILFDRPFEVGHSITVGDLTGEVRQIGIKTTRIRSVNGEEIIFSNTDLTNSRVRNFDRMQRRRILFRLGVTYDTALDQLQAIPDYLKAIVIAIPGTTFDRAHFVAYGDFSLILEIVYFIAGSDQNKALDIQQQVNLKIKEKFAAQGIAFAFPTQTIRLQREGAGLLS
ncbi:MAG: mechanosensitive ion channel family protein [Candidatus Omnitrophica bacterium]|nr:mechanosensitive ion channel family protein [Candidatus Omnitrophota bacterium]